VVDESLLGELVIPPINKHRGEWKG